MDENDVTDGLGELFRSGDLNMDVSTDPSEDTTFSLTDQGGERAEKLLRENDDAALMMLGLALGDMERPGDSRAVAKELGSVGRWLSESAGVNIFRVLRRNPDAMPAVDAEGLPERFVEKYDG